MLSTKKTGPKASGDNSGGENNAENLRWFKLVLLCTSWKKISADQEVTACTEAEGTSFLQRRALARGEEM